MPFPSGGMPSTATAKREPVTDTHRRGRVRTLPRHSDIASTGSAERVTFAPSNLAPIFPRLAAAGVIAYHLSFGPAEENGEPA